MANSVITITFSSSVENHAGMQIIGDKNVAGASFEECKEMADKFGGEFYNLAEIVEDEKDVPNAAIVVFRNGCEKILGIKPDDLETELKDLKWDKKAFMKGRVVNKIARYNLCFADEWQDAEYEEKRGTVYNFADLEYMDKARKNMGKFGKKFENLYAEGNYYYDEKKCYIGWHGDGERKLVFGLRLGSGMPLHYRWYSKNQKTDFEKTIELGTGDMYIMCEKAAGTDWKKRSLKWTLRHSAGSKKLFDKK